MHFFAPYNAAFEIVFHHTVTLNWCKSVHGDALTAKATSDVTEYKQNSGR